MGSGERGGLRSWFWEGHVQATVVAALVDHGWTVRRVADTARREPGKDVEAERDGLVLWATVKGFPADTPRTNPNTQARHWFTHALFDVILWRGEDTEARIVVVLPKMPIYLRLAARTTWFERAARYSYVWVTEGGVEGVPDLAKP